MSRFLRGKKLVDLILSKETNYPPSTPDSSPSILDKQNLITHTLLDQNNVPTDDDAMQVAHSEIIINDYESLQSNLISNQLQIAQLEQNDDSDDSRSYISNSDQDPNFIVSESEEDCSEEEENNNLRVEIQKSRKRKKNEALWKCNQRKLKRCAGMSYISKKNKVMPAKTLKPPCLPMCKKKCTLIISEEKRQEIFENFYREDFDINMKRLFIANRVRKVDLQRRRPRTGIKNNKRNYSLHYTFIVNDKEITVCKTFFLNTLCVSQSFVELALVKRVEGGGVVNDKRGKHTPSNKLKDDVRYTIRRHIESFPTLDSHYSRERTKRKYLGNDLNIKKMYLLYLEYCKDQNVAQEFIAKDWLYYEIFNNEYNLSFKQPANDTCDTCDEFKISIKQSSSSEKELLQIDYDRHLIESQRRYEMKAADKSLSRQDNTKKVIMIDLQKCLPTPYLTNSQIFYFRKLWTLNLTIFDASIKQTFCTMWDETVGNRGGCEIASCLFRWAKENLMTNDKVEELTIWSDNCGGQNRNYIMIVFYFWLLKQCPTLKIINHKFLLKGHTHMEVDVQHSVIERAKRKINNSNGGIMIPWDWQQFVRSCSTPNNPIEVYNMELEDFLNFKSLYTGITSPLVIRKKNNNNDNILISEMVHIQVRATDLGTLFYKNDFSQTDYERANFIRHTRRSVNWPQAIPLCSSTPKRISLAKYKDLQVTLKWVPTCFHSFYKNIPHGVDIEEYPEDDTY